MKMLSWPRYEKKEYKLSEDGYQLRFSCKTDGNAVFVRTPQSISPELDTFQFETKILDGGENFSIGIGFTTSLPLCGNGIPEEMDSSTVGLDLNEGVMYFGQNYTSVFDEKSSNGDVIGCYLERFSIKNVGYLAYEFFRNGECIGKQFAEETNVYPFIRVTSGDVILDTNLGEREFIYKKGNIDLSFTSICVSFYIYKCLRLYYIFIFFQEWKKYLEVKTH